MNKKPPLHSLEEQYEERTKRYLHKMAMRNTRPTDKKIANNLNLNIGSILLAERQDPRRHRAERRIFVITGFGEEIVLVKELKGFDGHDFERCPLSCERTFRFRMYERVRKIGEHQRYIVQEKIKEQPQDEPIFGTWGK